MGPSHRELTQPDGTIASTWLGPDPRFGADSLIPIRQQTELPSGRVSCVDQSRDFDEASGVLTNSATAWELPSGECGAPVDARSASSVYDPTARTLTTTSPGGRTGTTVFDADGRVIRVEAPGLADSHIVYDSAGRVERAYQTDSLGRTREIRYGFDSTNGHLRTITDGAGDTTHLLTDAIGRTTATTVGWDLTSDAATADATVTSFDYDEASRLTEVTPPGQPAHTMGYTDRDALSFHQTPLVGADEFVSAWSYDTGGRGTASSTGVHTGPAGGPWTPSIGFSETITPSYYPLDTTEPAGRRGQLHTLAFPTPSSTETITFDYYAPGSGTAPHPGTGRVSTIERSGGAGLAFSYDGSILTSSTMSGVTTTPIDVFYENGAAGFGMSAVDVDNGFARYRARYTYEDADGLVTGVEVQTGPTGGGGFTTLGTEMTVTPHADHGMLDAASIGVVDTDTEVNEFGNLELLDYSWTSAALPQGLRFEYRYDDAGRIDQITETRTTDGVPSVDTFGYGYDTQGRLETVTWDEGGGAVLSESYVYDDNGNRLEWSTDDDGPGPLPLRAWHSGIYDDRDRLQSYVDPDGNPVSYTYDVAGRIRTRADVTGTTTYDYDGLGNLLRVQRPGALPLIEYVLDGAGRRVGRRVGGVLETVWVYGTGLLPVAELNAAGAVQKLFVYATAPHSPDLIVDIAAGGAVYRVLRDHRGTPVQTIDTSTGAEIAQARFSTGGRLLVGGTGSTFGYVGGIADAGTGLIRLGARDYIPEVGRWAAPDPARWGGGQANLYEYGFGDPVDFIDPSGNSAIVGGILFVAFVASLILMNPGEAGDTGSVGRKSVCGSNGVPRSGSADQGYSGMLVDAAVALVVTAVATAAIASMASRSALAAQAGDDLVQVTSWAEEGLVADLAPGRWVQLGGPSRLNFWRTGLGGPKAYLLDGFPYVEIAASRVPFSNYITASVSRSALRWPSGVELFKGLFGQRIYLP